MNVKAYWARSENAGDRLTPWLIRRMTGFVPEYVPADSPEPHIVGAGSVANHAGPAAAVWGAGIASANDPVNPKAKFLAVRGPLTRKRVLECGGSCPEVYGDPGLLVPEYIPQKKGLKQFKLGITPHVVDYLDAVKWWGHLEPEGVLVIRMLDTIENVVGAVTSCECILSTSLHGLVFAHAYGIPAGWLQISNRIGGDGTKFRDHFASLGIQAADCLHLKHEHDLLKHGMVILRPSDPETVRRVCNDLKSVRPF